ncbi:acid protease [Stipitochalara longipes BDJ]|nr:acid protease [Stipitochalara longipes BDJ]
MRAFSFIQTTSVLFFYAAGTVAVKVPGAIEIPPAQYWKGNDGNWSTFPLNVGNPQQVTYVLPSTAGTATWLVGWMGCDANYSFAPLPAGCVSARGGLFDNRTSSTWQPKSTLNTWGLQVEEYLGIGVDAFFGFDQIFAGYPPSGVSLSNSTIAWFRDEAFAVGMFGLNYRPTNFSSPQDSSPTFLNLLYEQNKIPSLSYGYTAGAYYRGDFGFGSLVLGGYDELKIGPNGVTFLFDGDQSKDLTVGIKAITASNIPSSNAANLKIRDTFDLNPSNTTSTTSILGSVIAGTAPPAQTTGSIIAGSILSSQTTASSSTASPTTTATKIQTSSDQNLLPTPGNFFIDSTTSQIWLPQDACAMFEKAFGLVYDPDSELYLVNETQHDILVAQNSSITFSLTTNIQDPSADVVNITLPYAAFDLSVTWGYNITGPSRYFPIRHSNGTQYTLGRIFLQEAYLSVDNLKQKFTVSPRAWPYGNPSKIAPGPYSYLPPAIIAAIVLSICVPLGTIAFSIWFFLRRKRLADQKRKEEEEAEAARKAREKEEAIVPDPFATPDGVINELNADKLETPELFGRLLPFNGQEVDGSHASELRYELGRGMEGIEGRHELEAPHGISQAPASIIEESCESEGSRKSVDVMETDVSQPTETEGSTEGGAASSMDPVSPESSDGSSRGLLGSEDPVSPQSPPPVKLQNDRHLIYGFF